MGPGNEPEAHQPAQTELAWPKQIKIKQQLAWTHQATARTSSHSRGWGGRPAREASDMLRCKKIQILIVRRNDRRRGWGAWARRRTWHRPQPVLSSRLLGHVACIWQQILELRRCCASTARWKFGTLWLDHKKGLRCTWHNAKSPTTLCDTRLSQNVKTSRLPFHMRIGIGNPTCCQNVTITNRLRLILRRQLRHRRRWLKWQRRRRLKISTRAPTSNDMWRNLRLVG